MKTRLAFQIMVLTNLLLTNPARCYSQLTVDAGPDTIYCTNPHTNTLVLAENAKIENGTEPYSIAWECEVNSSVGLQTASDLLNDSTLISPTFKNGAWMFLEKATFILKVEDHNGQVARDTINVTFSGCACTLGYEVINLTLGDSVLIDAGTPSPHGNIVAYYWEPSYGLSAPDSAETWCKPGKTTDYNIVSIDSFGCHCSCHALEVRVTPTSTNHLKLNKNPNLNLRQVGHSIYFDNYLNEEVHISIFSINGSFINKHITTNNIFKLSDLKTKGLYIIKIEMEQVTDQIKVNYR